MAESSINYVGTKRLILLTDNYNHYQILLTGLSDSVHNNNVSLNHHHMKVTTLSCLPASKIQIKLTTF